MARKYQELRDKLPAEIRRRSDEWVKQELQKLPLYKLRQARELTQKQLAETLQVEQSSISKFEKRTDLYISTLRNFVEAMNGKLEIRAVFPDGAVELDLDEEPKETVGTA